MNRLDGKSVVGVVGVVVVLLLANGLSAAEEKIAEFAPAPREKDEYRAF